jgi:hypothetical protein
MLNKIKKILSIFIIGIMLGAIPTEADQLYWTGQGTESVGTCNEGEPQSMLWIFTFNQYGLNSPAPVLFIGSTSYQGTMNGNQYHFTTPYYDPNTLINKVYVDYNVADYRKGQLNLVISHGCSEIPEFPTVALPVAGVIGLLFFFYHKKRKI